jgi:hypothetical protein
MGFKGCTHPDGLRRVHEKNAWSCNNCDQLFVEIEQAQSSSPRRCSICDQPTMQACSDCAIDLRAVVYVCGKADCIRAHEAKCSHELRKRVRDEVNALTAEYPYLGGTSFVRKMQQILGAG